MPIIAPHQSQVGINVGNAGRAANYISESAFVTPGQRAMPQALDQLSKGMDKLGGVLFDAEIEKQRIQNATDLQNDEIAVKDATRAFQDDFEKNNKGADARDYVQATEEFLKTQIDPLQKKWGGNPNHMLAVQRIVEPIRAGALNHAGTYSDQQEKLYEQATTDKVYGETLRDFSDVNKTNAELSDSLGKYEIALRVQNGQRWDGERWVGGIPEAVDAKLAEKKPSLYYERAESLIAADRLEEARAFVKANAKELGSKANNSLIMIETKIEAAEKKREVAAAKAGKIRLKEIVNNTYSTLIDSVKDFPTLNEQKVAMEALIAMVENPDIREELSSRMDKDFRRMERIQNANDMVIGRKYREYAKEQGWTPGQALAGVVSVSGLSDEGREKLEKSLNADAQKITPENTSRRNELFRLIDVSAATSEEEIDAFAFKYGLTDKQRDEALKYMNDGGNVGKLTQTRVDRAWKSLDKNAKGKSKPSPSDLFDYVAENLPPGKPVSDDAVRKIIANYRIDGSSIDAGWFDLDIGETYSEAVKAGRGDSWLPDVSKEEESEIRKALQNLGWKNKDIDRDVMRKYKREKIMGIPAHGGKSE